MIKCNTCVTFENALRWDLVEESRDGLARSMKELKHEINDTSHNCNISDVVQEFLSAQAVYELNGLVVVDATKGTFSEIPARFYLGGHMKLLRERLAIIPNDKIEVYVCPVSRKAQGMYSSRVMRGYRLHPIDLDDSPTVTKV